MKKKSIIPINFTNDHLAKLEALCSEKFPNTFSLNKLNTQLINEVDETVQSLIFLHVDGNQDKARIKIWQLQKSHPNLPIVLCDSDLSSAYLAWKAGVFYFLKYPFSAIEMLRLAERLSNRLSEKIPKIKFNHKNGYTLIDPVEICFCKSDGNYTEIYLKDNRKVVVTKKLKDLEEIFRDNTFLYRIGKGHIINLRRIKNIHYQVVAFDGLSLPIKFSDIYLHRIKTALLWFV